MAQVPTSPGAVLDRLEADHEFLLQGDVFTPDLIETWIDFKRANEIAPLQLRPAPARVRDVLRRVIDARVGSGRPG
ncbi:glutamine synthetase [Streptomyces thinghirensis]|nr:glutamine synthetase [Streptomyces thinghirensis]